MQEAQTAEQLVGDGFDVVHSPAADAVAEANDLVQVLPAALERHPEHGEVPRVGRPEAAVEPDDLRVGSAHPEDGELAQAADRGGQAVGVKVAPEQPVDLLIEANLGPIPAQFQAKSKLGPISRPLSRPNYAPASGRRSRRRASRRTRRRPCRTRRSPAAAAR